MADKQVRFIPAMGRIVVKLSEEEDSIASSGYSSIVEVAEIGPSPDGRLLEYGVGDKVKLTHLHGHAWDFNGELFMTVNMIDVESKVEVVPGQQ